MDVTVELTPGSAVVLGVDTPTVDLSADLPAVALDIGTVIGGAVAATDPVGDLDPDWWVDANSIPVTPQYISGITQTAYAGFTGANALLGYEGLPPLTANAVGTVASTGKVAAVLPKYGWPGVQAIGTFQSTLDDAGGGNAPWPTNIDFRCRAMIHPYRYDPANKWSEILLVTVDNDVDYLEPAFVADDAAYGAQQFGVNLLTTGGELEMLSDPLPDPHQPHDYRFTFDASTGDWDIWVDGTVFTSGTAGGAVTLSVPPANHPVEHSKSTIGLAWFELRDDIDGTVIYSANPADDADDGDTTYTSGGRLWTSFSGLCQAAYTGQRMFAPGDQNHLVPDATWLDVGPSDSFTWAAKVRRWGVDPSGGLSHWGRNAAGLFASQPCWTLCSLPAFVGMLPGLDSAYTFALVSDTGYVIANLDVSYDEQVVVIVLDRATGELRAYQAGVLVDTVDATSIGSVTGIGDVELFTYSMSGEWAAMWRRALTAAEIATLT